MRVPALSVAVIAAMAGANVSVSSAFALCSRAFVARHPDQRKTTDRHFQPSQLGTTDVDRNDDPDTTPIIPFTPGVSFDFDNVTNDGLFAWMVPYLNIIGYKRGNTLVGGMPTKTMTSSMSKEEISAIKKEALETMTNIGPAERERRSSLGRSFLVAAALYAATSALFLDDGSLLGHLTRFAVLPLLFAGRGLQTSGNTGL